MFKRITIAFRGRPSFQFFFNNKRNAEMIELQNKILQLRAVQNQTFDIEQKISNYDEILQLHDSITNNQKGVCIEQLIDKLELFLLYKHQDRKIEENNLKMILELDLNDIHFDNIIKGEQSKSKKEYLKNQVKRDLHQLRIVCSLNKESVTKLKYWSEQFKEANDDIFEYKVSQLNETDHLNISINQRVRYQYLSIYHNLLGKIALGQNDIQEGIDQCEKSINYLQKAINIDKRVSENDDNATSAEQAQSSLQLQYHQLANELSLLANIQINVGNLAQAKILKTQALELFLLTTGNQSVDYVSTYCGLAYFPFVVKDYHTSYRMVEELYEQIQYSENKEAILSLSLFYFILKWKVGKGTKDLGTTIENLLNEKIRIHDKTMLIDYYSYQVEISASQGDKQLTQQYMERAVEVIGLFPDISQVKLIISLIKQFRHFHINDYRKLFQQFLQLLKNQQFRIDLFKDKNLDDEQVQRLLLQVEYYILFFELMLRQVHNVPIQVIVTRFLFYIDNFHKYETQAPYLMGNIEEYLQLLKNQNEIYDAIKIINHVSSILKQKLKSKEVDRYLRYLTDTKQEYASLMNIPV